MKKPNVNELLREIKKIYFDPELVVNYQIPAIGSLPDTDHIDLHISNRKENSLFCQKFEYISLAFYTNEAMMSHKVSFDNPKDVGTHAIDLKYIRYSEYKNLKEIVKVVMNYTLRQFKIDVL